VHKGESTYVSPGSIAGINSLLNLGRFAREMSSGGFGARVNPHGRQIQDFPTAICSGFTHNAPLPVRTLSGDTGTFFQLSQSTGERIGNTVESWLYALHMTRVFGRPYQIFVCALGFAVSMLSITGVYLW
jgi:uncharacterized iron-regulated membrane protein